MLAAGAARVMRLDCEYLPQVEVFRLALLNASRALHVVEDATTIPAWRGEEAVVREAHRWGLRRGARGVGPVGWRHVLETARKRKHLCVLQWNE